MATSERGFVRRRSLWELDHVVPLIDGGGHEPSNLQTLCVPCHREKSARELAEMMFRFPVTEPPIRLSRVPPCR